VFQKRERSVCSHGLWVSLPVHRPSVDGIRPDMLRKILPCWKLRGTWNLPEYFFRFRFVREVQESPVVFADRRAVVWERETNNFAFFRL
ncbi:hypothetical protein, partial [Leptospira bandrabouensis]|uniref:hypothetical protein n=1 Tax=Leptospira bandrabouensis TaxID=2484903 RepID=UPI001EE86108